MPAIIKEYVPSGNVASNGSILVLRTKSPNDDSLSDLKHLVNTAKEDVSGVELQDENIIVRQHNGCLGVDIYISRNVGVPTDYNEISLDKLVDMLES